ncbi:unnamed protein product [Polarella glacialis]|uniref:Uncharacterized protein n=1 Tax=Polarella glacialis TaxID=89957 RepID=A0A813FSW6_POLGL|nr:unnamed protein product [Polarella glacialis]
MREQWDGSGVGAGCRNGGSVASASRFHSQLRDSMVDGSRSSDSATSLNDARPGLRVRRRRRSSSESEDQIDAGTGTSASGSSSSPAASSASEAEASERAAGGGGLRSHASECSSSGASSSPASSSSSNQGKYGKGSKKGSIRKSLQQRQGKGPPTKEQALKSRLFTVELELELAGSSSIPFTTLVELPASVLRALQSLEADEGARDWSKELSVASGAQVEVDSSRRAGHARVQIVGGWRQSLVAYRLILRGLARQEADSTQPDNNNKTNNNSSGFATAGSAAVRDKRRQGYAELRSSVGLLVESELAGAGRVWRGRAPAPIEQQEEVYFGRLQDG